jgi:hypothetical protein
MAGIRIFPDEANLYAKARTLGQELCRSIKDKRVYPGQDAFREEFKLRMSGLVDMMKEYWPFERDHWAKKLSR